MALRKILKEGDPTLKKTARPVTEFNDRLAELLDDMAETMISADGLGLAGPQVGVLRRVVTVFDPETDKVLELVNPEILTTEGNVEGPEGCLSFPGLYGIVARPDKVRVRAFDRKGELHEYEGKGIVARAFCHETEHLDGHLFTERVIRYLNEDEAGAEA
jgi:peptide deformylase